jgi:hypothetical protein
MNDAFAHAQKENRNTIGDKHVHDMNHMAGPHGPIGPWLSHELCSIVNVTLILSMKAAIDYSYHELHGDIQFYFILMLTQLIILGVLCSFSRWIFGEIK